MSHPLRDTVRAVRCDCGKYAPPGQPCSNCGTVNGSSPYRGHDPQSPPGAEAALQSFLEALGPAREALEAAANEEVGAELARDAARRKWMLQAPPVRRNEWTVAERDCWVEDHITEEERAYRLAKAKRQAAAKVLDVLGKQLSAQQSINRSVSASYQGTGDRW